MPSKGGRGRCRVWGLWRRRCWTCAVGDGDGDCGRDGEGDGEEDGEEEVEEHIGKVINCLNSSCLPLCPCP